MYVFPIFVSISYFFISHIPMVFERKNLKSSISDNLQMTIEKKNQQQNNNPSPKEKRKKKKKKMYQCLPNEKIIGLLRIFYEL